MGIAKNPSPGNPNNNVQSYYAGKPGISPAAGLFTSPIQVSISAAGSNLTIRYFEVKTLCDNGSESAYTQFSFETGCPVDMENLKSTVAAVDIYPKPFKQNVTMGMILLESQHVGIEIFDIREFF